jgi:hypothetical protein
MAVMNENDPEGLIREVIDAHGGEALWNSIDMLDAVISTSGFLFTAKRRPVLSRMRMRAWAHAAHLCEDYRDFGGIKAPIRRRVYPILVGSRPLPWPTLVSLDIHDIRPVLKQP